MPIKNLIQKYEDDRDTYLSQSYNESQLRTDFLDPFFEILGWDIKNNQGKPTNEREVLVEESLKAGAGSNTKKPDYTFRLFSERKFFLEAKKPSVKIHTDEDSAKQVRRYGFTAKLKISVLSNFEYLAIYDCSQKVAKTDTADNSRIIIYHYTEYADKINEIKHQLSHNVVYNGEFDETWKNIEDQLKLSSIDSLFLEQINEWRVTLGTEIYSCRNTLNEEALNDIVQSYINSIIFLRVCEDRQIEEYKTLFNFANNKDFKSLIKKFKDADKRYNAGLFSHPLTEKITKSSSAFWEIIKQLYYPESTYSFSVFSSDILGNIYEIFLSEQLKIVNGSILLAKKPENIDRDIVTTPTYIIQEILRQTVIKHCEGKTAQEILDSKFSDIACGSGAFLLEVYQLLHDILVDCFQKEKKKSLLIPTGVNSFKLNFNTKKELLTQCIYGVDKDFNAVQACKFGLLLKLLEGENSTTIQSPILPNMDDNISFGNSLINAEVAGKNNIAINPFDFNVKFDVIVGNPPYMSTEDMKKFTPLELPLYKEYYKSSFKQFDKYFLFIEQGLELLNTDGYFGYIVPSKFTKIGAGKKLREHLVSKQVVRQIISFGANQVFEGKTTYTCLLILKNCIQQSSSFLEVRKLNDLKTRTISTSSFETIDFTKTASDEWVLVPKTLKSAYKKINEDSKTLEELVGSDGIYNGIQTSANKIYIHTPIKEDKKYLYFKEDDKEWKIERERTRPYYKTSKGVGNLDTYRPFSPNSFVIYPYFKNKGKIEFVDINIMKKDYPYAFAYLKHHKKTLNDPKRDIKPQPASKDEWYRYGRHQSLDKCEVPAKIIVGVLSQGNKYAIDFHGTLISSGGTAGYCMITLPDQLPYSIYYIQALLNSKYLEWYASLIGEVFRGGYIARGTKVLKKIPIRTIDFQDKKEKNIHDTIAHHQENLISLQGKIDKNLGNSRILMPLKRQFKILKDDLDSTLQTLYNLGSDDSIIPLISEIYATN